MFVIFFMLVIFISAVILGFYVGAKNNKIRIKEKLLQEERYKVELDYKKQVLDKLNKV